MIHSSAIRFRRISFFVMLWVSVSLIMAPSQAFADKLAEWDYFSNITGEIQGDNNAIDIDAGSWPVNSSPNSAPYSVIFDDVFFNQSSVGKSFFATPATEGNFNEYESHITDGIQDFHGIREEAVKLDSNGNVVSRSGFIKRSIIDDASLFSSLGAVDAQGYTIDSAELYIKSLSISQLSPTTSNYSLGLTYRIYGTPTVTPEPATMALFGIGGAALAAKRLKRKKAKRSI